MGVKFEDEIMGLWLLNTLLDSWENLRVSLIGSAPGDTVTMEYVKTAVLNEEVRRRTHETSTSKSDVLVTENRRRSKDRDQGEYKRGKSRSKSKSKYKNVECHYCHKKGHLMKNCFKLKNKDKNKPEGRDGENDRHVATTTPGDLIIVCDTDLINVAFDEIGWVIDSGASFHVTSRKDFFISYTPGDYGVLKMGNDGRSNVVGMGDVVLETKTGMKLVLKNVRHAPDIRLNLISTSVYQCFGDGQCKLTKGSLIVARGKKCSAFVHVPKDERSKLDVKTRPCIFIGYGHDEFGYRLYDPVEKKLVRSRDVIFMEDQNIEDIKKMEKSESQRYDDLVDLNPTPVSHMPAVTNEDQVDDQNQVPHDFVDGNGEEDSNESAIHLSKKIHTDDNGSDMMTKALTKGKFEVCCLIAGLATSST
ncbi:unnamed protein product [Cuscuta campestris]|uniref:CCHC-type domain-containing protein n=1 Tax=Cuscuta campestris TaxID=132261 RepID=A0A484KXE4_9ASTE|nr:unnamed protein product [Cuscuta campestris]